MLHLSSSIYVLNNSRMKTSPNSWIMQTKGYLLILTVVLNLSLCAMVFVESNSLRHEKGINEAIKRELDAKDKALAFAYSSFFEMRDHDLQSDVYALKLINSLKHNGLYLFIPKYPCDVCLNNELDVIMEYRIGITILAPDYRVKALKAKFGKADNIRVDTYISDTIESENTVAREDNLFYFTVKNDKVSDCYPVNKYYPAARQVFFNYLQTH